MRIMDLEYVVNAPHILDHTVASNGALPNDKKTLSPEGSRGSGLVRHLWLKLAFLVEQVLGVMLQE